MEVIHPNCAGLDVHKETVLACSRRMAAAKVTREVRTFQTTTSGLLALSEWLASHGVTHVVMEATGVYWKPVWNILDDGDFVLTLANAAHVKNVPGRKTDVNDATSWRSHAAHGRSPICRRTAWSAPASCLTRRRRSNAGCCARGSN